MEEETKRLVQQFRITDSPISAQAIGAGHINRTFRITVEGGRQFILQRINTNVFKDVDVLMDNIVKVTRHLKAKGCDERTSMTVIPAKDGRNYIKDVDGSCWRMFIYINDSLCLQTPRTTEDFRQSAVAFGNFQSLLLDFPAKDLKETIPGFHNTVNRFRQFNSSIETACKQRRDTAKEDIQFLLKREELAGNLLRKQADNQLPTRVTHNDTKLNNVLLDPQTGKALCVIDLDTVMPGLNAYDFGDAIRFGASTADEDEKDLCQVKLDLGMVEVFTKGFTEACPDLTKAEVRALPWGALTLTLEQAARFLTDYLNNDVYYPIDYPEHNLVRARTQIKLCKEMEYHWDKLQSFLAI